MFKGTAKHPAGEFSQTVLRDRRQRKRLHLDRLHRLFPARAARAARHDDGIRGRPHDRPDPEGRERAARARRRARGIQHARRQQPGCAADRADHGGAVSQPSLWPPGDRLAPGDREARPRGCARVLQALLRAEQRDPGDRRRRRRQRRSARWWRRAFGDDPAAAGDSRAAPPSAGAGAGGAAHRDAVRSARRAARPAALLPRSLRHDRGRRRKPGARRAGAADGRRLQLLSLPRAGDRPAARDQRRRRLPGHRARSVAILDLGLAEARRRVFADRAGDRRA